MSIKAQIERLTLEQRRQLSHAFDHGFSQFVKFGDNEYIGIHINSTNFPNLEILESTGVWSYGKIRKN